MAETIRDRLSHAWNAFNGRDPFKYVRRDIGVSQSARPDRVRLRMGNERSIVAAIYNQISIDVAAVEFYHCRVDDEGNYQETIDSKLNKCLTLEANIDQSSRAFIQDIVLSMFDEPSGCVAIVPVEATMDLEKPGSYDITTLRTGKILEWFPHHVKVRVYNQDTGLYEDLVVPKKTTAIVENPLATIMNGPNSTLQRLITKLNLLDAIDQQSGSGKLDLIIQLPYTIRGEARRAQAEKRRKDIEVQMVGSKYGIAYIDATERITQLNRPVENNLLAQIQYLTSMLFSQLGLTQAIFDGTADQQTMLNYHNRTVEPIVSAIADAMRRAFLTKTGRTQGQSIKAFKDPFKLVPVGELSEIADKFTRNEILSPNEVRSIIGRRPSNDPRADELRNRNLNSDGDQSPIEVSSEDEEAEQN